MAVTFNTKTGIVPQEGTAVRSEIAQQWKKAFQSGDNDVELNTDPETPAGQLIDGQAALVIQKDSEIAFLANMFNPMTAQGVWQEALAKIYFLSRHAAERTAVTCTCKGLYGTSIPYGAIVQDTDGNEFYNASPVTIGSGGSVETTFRASEYGAIEVDAGAVNKIITVIPGWDSVTNAAAGVTGRDSESQQEFEQRRYNSVAKNSHGLAESVQGAIANITDVVASKIVQNRNGEAATISGVTVPGHSVYLSVYGGTSAEIGNVLHEKLDAGCGTAGNTAVVVTDGTSGHEYTYYYTVPETKALYVKISAKKGASYTESDVKAAVTGNLNGDDSNYERIVMGDAVYASRLYQTVITAGIDSLVSVELSRDGTTYADSVTYNLNEMPVIADANITIEEVS